MVAVADLDHMAAGAALERWGSELSDPFTSDHRTSTPWPAPDDLRTATVATVGTAKSLEGSLGHDVRYGARVWAYPDRLALPVAREGGTLRF